MGVVVVGTGAPDLAVAGGGGHGGRCGGHCCPEPGGRSRLGAGGPVWWALVLRTWRVGQGPSWRLAGGFRSRWERRARSTVSLTEVAAVRICSPVTPGRLAAAPALAFALSNIFDMAFTCRTRASQSWFRHCFTATCMKRGWPGNRE